MLAGCTTYVATPKEVFFPEPSGYVVDSAGVLTDSTEVALTDQLKKFNETAQIAVVTVKTTAPLSLEEYSIKLAEKFGVGDAKEDNGVILLIVTEDRKLRIEVGYGLEGKITDAAAGQLLDNYVVPELRNGDWDAGALAGVIGIIKAINK